MAAAAEGGDVEIVKLCKEWEATNFNDVFESAEERGDHVENVKLCREWEVLGIFIVSFSSITTSANISGILIVSFFSIITSANFLSRFTMKCYLLRGTLKGFGTGVSTRRRRDLWRRGCGCDVGILSLSRDKLKSLLESGTCNKCCVEVAKLRISWVSGIAVTNIRARLLPYAPGVIESSMTATVFRVILTFPHATFAVRKAIF